MKSLLKCIYLNTLKGRRRNGDQSHPLGEKACGGVLIAAPQNILFTPILLKTDFQGEAIRRQTIVLIPVINMDLPPGLQIKEQNLKHILHQLLKTFLFVSDIKPIYVLGDIAGTIREGK